MCNFIRRIRQYWPYNLLPTADILITYVKKDGLSQLGEVGRGTCMEVTPVEKLVVKSLEFQESLTSIVNLARTFLSGFRSSLRKMEILLRQH